MIRNRNVLLGALLLICFVTLPVVGCRGIKKITQGISAPSEPGQHVDIGHGWNQSLGSGWQEPDDGLRSAVRQQRSYGFDARFNKEAVDSCMVIAASDKIVYHYNLLPTEQNSGLVGMVADSVEIIALELRPSDDSCYFINENVDVDRIDISDYDVGGYIHFEFELPTEGLFLLFGIEGTLVLTR